MLAVGKLGPNKVKGRQMKKYPAILFLFIVLSLIASCTQEGSDANPDQEAPAPANEALESGSTETGAISPASTFSWISLRNHLTQLPAYNLEMTVDFTPAPGADPAEAWRLVELQTSGPAGRSLSLAYEGNVPAPEAQSLTIIQLGNQSYLSIPSVGCVSGSAAEFDRAQAGSVDPDRYIAGLTGAELIPGLVEFRGVPVRQYQFNERSLPQLSAEGIIAEGQLYLAEGSGRVAGLVLTITGLSDFDGDGQGENGTLKLELNVVETSESQALAIPPECSQPPIYPLVDDASSVTMLGELLRYETGLPAVDVAQFYLEQMAAEGWAVVDEPAYFEDAIALVFERNGISVTVDIGQDSQAQITTVLVSP